MYGLSFSQFSRLHPFHLVIDADMFIVQAGAGLRKVIPEVTGKKFYQYFELRRPRLKPRFDEIREAKNAAFLIACTSMQISLKGQMLLDENRKLLFFAGAPVVENVALLRRYHFTLSDFPMTDSSIDILVQQQQKLINKKLEGLVLERARDLELERNKSEMLLHAILPAHIARELKDRREVIAEQFEQVTVMFLDLVGFTELTARLSAAAIVNLLNDIFQKFDVLLESTDVEKIKTIGDAYMCVGGLSGLSPKQSAERVALVALQMLHIIEDTERAERLRARIGIHSGPVVAGVIGASKFSYDLWGDTVNTAARMESHGEPGKIHCTASVHHLLRESFDFEDRGEIHVRGKGRMQTWFLVGEKSVQGGDV
jgi:guanylate cyclase soluble subunit beta